MAHPGQVVTCKSDATRLMLPSVRLVALHTGNYEKLTGYLSGFIPLTLLHKVLFPKPHLSLQHLSSPPNLSVQPLTSVAKAQLFEQ